MKRKDKWLLRSSWVPAIIAAAAFFAGIFAAPCFGEGTGKLRQVTNVSSANTKPPSDAIVLFDGKSTDAWTRMNGERCRWELLPTGAMRVRGGSIITKQKFTDFQLHLEFKIPYMPEAKGQGRGNSGVYMQGLYEVQVLDSYGLDSKDNDCGGIYRVSRPMVNACLKPAEWQSYDVLFHSPRFDESGKMVKPARISVLQNGVWIQDNAEAWKRTTASMNEKEQDEKEPGPILLQDHGNPVQYRNIWIRPLGPTVR